MWAGDVVGSPRRVVSVLTRVGVERERVTFHRGWFADTFPLAAVSAVSLVHIDCDFYEPTRLCIDRWWPALAPGGFVQFDDYSAFEGCYRAVNEFLQRHPELELQESGASGKACYLRKPGSAAAGASSSSVVDHQR